MSNCAVVGINWGDEGKGRMVDLLTEDFDIVVRYQGGGNAGHTVINEYGKFALHLLPSGIFRPGVVNVLGPGVALDLQSLWEEIELLRANGVYITPENLMISERAGLLLPWHKEQDALEERRLGAHKYGSTGQGIAPFYSDKYQKKTLQAGDLAYPAQLRERLAGLLEWKNLILTRVYGAPGHELGEIEAWLEKYGAPLRPYIRDTGRFLSGASAAGKGILFEAQLGALRDLEQGICPYTTSSNTLAAYALMGGGPLAGSLDEVVGVVKAYSTCVGEGPFVCEWSGPEAEALREAGSNTARRQAGPGASGPSTSWRRATACAFRARPASLSPSSTCSATWIRYPSASPTRWTAPRRATSPSPPRLRGQSPSSNTWTAGAATSPKPENGPTCPLRRGATCGA